MTPSFSRHTRDVNRKSLDGSGRRLERSGRHQAWRAAFCQKLCELPWCQGGRPRSGLEEEKRRRDLPPPPLNGTAHAWHHSPALLDRIIREGGATYGKAYKGWMPAFGDKLDAAERLAILKYLHSLWPEAIRQRYDKRFLEGK